MAKLLTIRKGCKARYAKTIYDRWGTPVRTIEKVVTIIDRARDEDGCYCPPSDWGARVRVQAEDGETFTAKVEDLGVYNTMADLTHEDYMQLRREIRHGSLYLSDYRNSFGVDENAVYACSEGFGMETGWSDEQDTPENFADYCDGIEFGQAA